MVAVRGHVDGDVDARAHAGGVHMVHLGVLVKLCVRSFAGGRMLRLLRMLLLICEL